MKDYGRRAAFAISTLLMMLQDNGTITARQAEGLMEIFLASEDEFKSFVQKANSIMKKKP